MDWTTQIFWTLDIFMSLITGYVHEGAYGSAMAAPGVVSWPVGEPRWNHSGSSEDLEELFVSQPQGTWRTGTFAIVCPILPNSRGYRWTIPC